MTTKDLIIAQFVQRYALSLQTGITDNTSLVAESPMFYHCKHCGILIESLIEDHFFPAHTICSQCEGLQKMVCLQEAKQMCQNLGTWPRRVFNTQTNQFEIKR